MFENTIFFRFRAFLHGFTGKASLDRCIDNVCHFPSEEALYLLTDASMTHRVDPDSLDTIDEVFVEKLTTNVLVWCAHPLKEPEDNVVWNVGTSYDGSRFHYSVLKFNETGVASGVEIGKIPSRRRDQPCYMHSFGMSEDFIVILEQPLFVDKTATNGINLHHHLKWKSHLPVSKIPIPKTLFYPLLVGNFYLPLLNGTIYISPLLNGTIYVSPLLNGSNE